VATNFLSSPLVIKQFSNLKCVAALYLALYPLIAYSLSKIAIMEEEAKQKELDKHNALHTDGEQHQIAEQAYQEHAELQVEYSKLLRVARFTLGLLAQVLCFTTFTFVEPTLSIYLRSGNNSLTFIGLAFTLPAFVAILSSSFAFILAERFKKQALILLGFILVGLMEFVVGPSVILGFPRNDYVTVAGVILIALFIPLITIPVMPDVIEAASERYPTMAEEILHNKISGVFVAC